ncbi:echinoderm microtubule-associated protein-like 1 isoform X1 [Hydractinia symbiolongicarpus]|uniref:echinoderm microtubule-associated protein-like 1 isoform X1 n=1 Tax=Hydractinia symbiolongicarpus TaxID=13093 RepID=UPI00254EEFFF|nr:echinoderm microtubule-associated protein-like 1 isoform X1 [Hydractinia symbiolongicarpus]
MYPSTHYKTKIIGGKIVTVPVHNNNTRNYNTHGYPSAHSYGTTTHVRDYTQENAQYRYDTSSNIQININASARHEAQKNKQRAIAQTYRSILSPEPTYKTQACDSWHASDPFTNQVKKNISSASRHQLLSAFSSMRRLDPYENGILSGVELHEVLAVHNIHVDPRLTEALIKRYQVSSGGVAYVNMWKYIMDCFGDQDKFGTAEKSKVYQQHLEEYYRNTLYEPYERSSKPHIQPSLQAELEFELRHFARSNQMCLNTENIQYICQSLDKYNNGKLLHKQVLDICYRELTGIDINIITKVIRACDTENRGLVDYPLFLKTISDCQPTYLPPINTSPRALVSGDIGTMWNPHQSYTNMNNQQKIDIHVPTGNAKELEKLGGLDLHLSDFETQIHSKKSPVLTPSPPREASPNNVKSVLETAVEIRNRTYSIDSNNDNSPILPVTDERESTYVQNGKERPVEQARNVSSPQKSAKRTPSRRQWNETKMLQSELTTDTNKLIIKQNHRSVSKMEKWWKKELDSSGNSGYGFRYGRKTWGQSKPVKSIKGKRKRKPRKFKKSADSCFNVVKHELTTDSECLTATDMDSEVYTTTDIEVGEEIPIKKKLSPFRIVPDIPSRIENGKKSLITHEKDNSSVLPSNKVESGSLIEDNEGHKNGIVSTIEKEEKGEDDIVKMVEKVKLVSLSPSPTSYEEKGTIDINGKSFFVYPSYAKTSVNESAPEQKLQLEWIYGYGKKLNATSTKEIIFYTGRVVVAMDTEKQKQRFYRKHTENITSLCVHADKTTVASAQERKDAKCIIYIWNVIDLSTTSSIFIISDKVLKIVSMDFCQKDTTLVAVQTTDSGFSICVYDYVKGVVKYQLKEDDPLLKDVRLEDVLCSPINGSVFVTYGRNGSLLFCNIKEDNISGDAAEFGALEISKNILCAVFNKNGDLITGHSNGGLYVWRRNKIDHAIHNAHNGPITAMCFTKHGYLLTGSSREDVVLVWDEQMKCIFKEDKILKKNKGCRDICIYDDVMCIGTSSNSLIKTSINPVKIFSLAEKELVTLSECHADVVMGICKHPSYNEMMISLSADGCVCMINIETKVVVWMHQVKGNGSCISFHSLDEFIFVGCQDGSIHLIDATNGTFVEKFKDTQTSISCLQSSPDGKLLVCGMADGKIVCYNFDDKNKDLEMNIILKKDCINPIVSIDWCISNSIIRAQSVTKEIFYFDVPTGNVVDNNESMIWSTNTCTISYELLGLWRKKVFHAKNSPLDVSKKKELVAFAHENQLCLANYPCVTEKSMFIGTPCCGYNDLGCICFTLNGTHVVTSYECNGCLWQWKLV